MLYLPTLVNPHSWGGCNHQGYVLWKVTVRKLQAIQWGK
jgi:hypothetical protein